MIYANDMYLRGYGNCFSFASAFAYLAKAIGYENVYCCNSGGHGWAEINGLIYDLEQSKNHSNYPCRRTSVGRYNCPQNG